MKKNKAYILIILLVSIVLLACYKTFSKDNTMKIHVGYQSVTSQTWGALIMMEQKIFEKKLQEFYPNQKIEVIWHDEISGSVINTSMISNKYHFGFMGDMPLLLNMYKASTLNNYNSALIAFDGKGIGGKNQSIIVPIKSNLKTITDLKGKTVTTPIGSSAHFMLMKVLEKYNLLNEVDIVHQDVALASQLLVTEKIDAFSIWAPYPNFLLEKGHGRILLDGSESEIDYLNGVMVNKSWADDNKDIVRLFVESLDEAHEFIVNNQETAAKIFNSESGFSYKITTKEIENILWESAITEENIKTLEEKMKFLVNINQIKEFDLKAYIYN